MLLGDLGDRARGAGILAGTATHARILVGHNGDVVDLEHAGRAGVDANATSDALVGINYGMSHGSFLSVALGPGEGRQLIGFNIPCPRGNARPWGSAIHTVHRVTQG